MRLTSYTDFGLRALLYLATLPQGELSSVAKVSALYDVSRNHMVKVVNQLVKLGYLQSQRGKNGVDLGQSFFGPTGAGLVDGGFSATRKI